MNKKKKFDWYGVIRVLTSILIALVIAALIIFAVADDPLTALNKFLLGPFSTKRNFFNAVETMIPLVFCGLAINVMHKSGLFSMAADSSFYFSGVVAAMLAIACPMPAGVHQLVILTAATLVGGVIGIIPVIIKKKTGANELVISLMMNYIKRTAFGIRIRAVGESAEAARSVGINVERVRYQAMFISGILASLGGMYLSMGYVNRFTANMVAGRGYVALATNAMAAGNALMGMVSSILYGFGSGISIYLQNNNVDPYLITIIPYASIIIFYVAFSFYYKVKKKADSSL